MKKYILASGKKVEITLCPTEMTMELYYRVLGVMQKCGIEAKLNENEKLIDLLLNNLNVLIGIMGSKEVVEAIKDLCVKVIYDGKRFSMDIFEDEKNKQDLFPILLLVAIVNVEPFFPQLRIVFSALTEMILA